MTGAEWTGLSKLVLDIASQLKDAVSRSRDHTLSFSGLIGLHENLTRSQQATDDLLVNRTTPTLAASELEAQSTWLDLCRAAIHSLAKVDRAIIRVYSPQLASYIERELPRFESGFVKWEMEQNSHRWSGNLRELGNLYQQIEALQEAFVTTHWSSDEPIDLRQISDALGMATAELQEFIRRHWVPSGRPVGA